MDYLEIDVSTSKDGVLYLLHGPEFDRTTNGKGLIAQMTSEEIDQLDAGSWFDSKFAEEKIPRLELFLRWIKGKIKIYFDVRAADHKQLAELVYAVGMQNDCFFWSKDSEWIPRLRELYPSLPIKINANSIEDVVEADEVYQADIIQMRLNNMSKQMVDACRQRGIKIMIYHREKDVGAFREVLRWGVDMIICDHGNVFAEVAKEFYRD
jgi:glycerophosphoryl diester phosphodiesterase